MVSFVYNYQIFLIVYLLLNTGLKIKSYKTSKELVFTEYVFTEYVLYLLNTICIYWNTVEQALNQNYWGHYYCLPIREVEDETGIMTPILKPKMPECECGFSM